ncbi:hypothetical protein JX265_006839 [Neoarthrinium moseri]|uniref:Uncharacterized protein n=1 Tax=Neoarthrinium moseri TaxID=1658444 RepID=A0A9P9WKZ6_9PEZI|nr:hypothetical protein JX265_006839 [Neoarthrinium moseri]
MMDKVKEFGNMDLVPIAFDFAEDGSCLSRDFKPLVVGPGRDNAEIEAYISAMIPVSYISTSADMTVPLNYQQNFVQGLKKEGREVQTFELATGHCPNFTATKEVADIVEKNDL